MKFKVASITLVWMMMLLVQVCHAESGFTQEDRNRLIRLEATLQTFMQQVDKRIEDLRKNMNKRFERVDKRFEGLREDTNKHKEYHPGS